MEWDAAAIMKIAVGVFFILFGVGTAYALFRLAEVFKRLSNILADANTQVIPLLTRVAGTLDGVNSELGKVDEITASLGEIVKTVEVSVAALREAVSRPIKKVAGLAAGMSEGVSSFFGRRGKED